MMLVALHTERHDASDQTYSGIVVVGEAKFHWTADAMLERISIEGDYYDWPQGQRMAHAVLTVTMQYVSESGNG